MYKKDNCDLQIDLVFKCNNFSNLSDYFLDKSDNIIFESGFWEKVFLSLQIINDNQISSINQNWMNKSGPTDVLSFPIISNVDTTRDLNFIELGDLFISLEMAIKQSLEFNHSLKREMLWLVSHGLLHLLGWEHNDDNELDNMLNFQEYLISKLD